MLYNLRSSEKALALFKSFAGVYLYDWILNIINEVIIIPDFRLRQHSETQQKAS